MIQRGYLTEYDEYLHGNRYNITIYTDYFHVFKAIKAYAESVCEKEELLNSKMQVTVVTQNEQTKADTELSVFEDASDGGDTK